MLLYPHKAILSKAKSGRDLHKSPEFLPYVRRKKSLSIHVRVTLRFRKGKLLDKKNRLCIIDSNRWEGV